jgi:hypothetical protein
MKAYRGTKVAWAKTQTKIVKLLNSKKIFETRFTNLQDKFVLEFRATNEAKPIAIRIIVPLKTQSTENKQQQELNIMHRVLFHHIKAKFIAIECGLTEFMEEFMPHLIIMDKNGNSTTMGQTLLPQYKESLESGKQKPFLLGDGN